MDGIKELQEWQLRQLIDILSYEYHDIAKSFPGFFTKAYYVRPEGIDWVEFRGRRLSVVKTMSRADLQHDQDVFFRQPHRVVQVSFKDKVLLVGFWCDNCNIDNFMTWLQERIPDAVPLTDTERILFGKILVE